ncbi:MAG: DUF1800 domain-containing protein [Sphingomonas sp.]|nr:DUF1800 domain-containing protein [Sphingomonas sp.]
MGGSGLDIADVQARGYAGWLDAQFATARGQTHWDWLVAKGYRDVQYRSGVDGFDISMWRQLIGGRDQLRQRVAMALLELMVVGIDDIQVSWRQFAMAGYVDLLLDNAFGNFRTLMERIATNPAMSSYLTCLGNKKANPAKGSLPDENFARELMQLFTIGLYQLNMDGSQKLSGGKPIETYTQTDVSQLARVFTGLTLATTDNTTPDRVRMPLVLNETNRETGTSSFLGTTVPAGVDGTTARKIALDAIFNHANVAPFVSKQLIQRLVTSNPSAAYVGRIAAVFANNGAGVRGDLKAVVRAILLDSEARNDPSATETRAGKLREPMIRITNWARAFGAASASDQWAIGDTGSATTRVNQSPGRSTSVFNFFRPGYVPPNSAIATAGLVGPEFQLNNELSVVAYVNYLVNLVGNAVGDVRADYSALTGKASNSQALVDEVNVLLAANQISAATVAQIKAAVDSSTDPASRIGIAVLLAMSAPEYITLK